MGQSLTVATTPRKFFGATRLRDLVSVFYFAAPRVILLIDDGDEKKENRKNEKRKSRGIERCDRWPNTKS